ncbi:MAG TPA: hypothetical protein VE783_01130 [Candidatus Limnocylindrales bacterium]|jgi:hypothetical protein|nr:hypothetical protein [Candidatus Limnocylindrales bacterium]
MKRFANIQDALEFAAANHSLKFPFNCRCNGFTLKVLSPDLARTTDRDRPTLVVSRSSSGQIELGYIVSLQALQSILKQLSAPQARYSLLCGREEVTVLCDEPLGETQRFTFPIARKHPELAEQTAEYVLLLSRSQAKAWHRFWLPLESRLLHSSIASVT